MTTLPTSHFTVTADPDPQILLKVLGFFSQRSLVPAEIQAKAQSQELKLSIIQPDMGENVAQLVAEKLRSCVLVRNVDLTFL